MPADVPQVRLKRVNIKRPAARTLPRHAPMPMAKKQRAAPKMQVNNQNLPKPKPLPQRRPPHKTIPAVKSGPALVRMEDRMRQRRETRNNRVLRPQGDKLITNDAKKILAFKGKGKGKVLVIIACGPSFLEADVSGLVDNPRIDIMWINKPIKGIPAQYWSFCDHSQYVRNQEMWELYGGTIFNSSAVRAKRSNQIVIKNKGGRGFSKDLTQGYYIGRSSTYASMQIAYYMGYDAVFIFGIDMCAVGGKLHHYGNNPDVKDQIREQRFKDEAAHYDHAANNLDQSERNRYYFCSSYNPFEFVNRFNRLDHKKAPEFILEYVKRKNIPEVNHG